MTVPAVRGRRLSLATEARPLGLRVPAAFHPGPRPESLTL